MGATHADIAALELIDLALLNSQDPPTLQKLLSAAQSTGFFYLDLRNDPSGKKLLSYLPGVYKLSDEYFDQPADVKLADIREDQQPSQDRGYKKSDCDETFEISRNELKQGQLVLPGILNEHLKLLEDFCEISQHACLTMLSSVSSALGLSSTDSFEKYHYDADASDTGLKLICEPSLSKLSDVGENKHTDSGTFTLTFYEAWGLHARDPATGEWAFTEPREGCVLVNVANSLQRLSGGKLHSPVHRVTQVGDGAEKRYFLAYFLRPAHSLKESWEKGE